MKSRLPKLATTTNRIKPVLVLPPGVRFGDLYMDAAQVAQELNFSKRTVRNMRVSGKLSWTTLYGKVFYMRQEIAEHLLINKVPGKKPK